MVIDGLCDFFPECGDCEVEWGKWSPCSNGERRRKEYIKSSAYGMGKPCPIPWEETEKCIDCQVVWGSWSGCNNGVRIRKQEISVERVGAGMECPNVLQETEGKYL